MLILLLSEIVSFVMEACGPDWAPNKRQRCQKVRILIDIIGALIRFNSICWYARVPCHLPMRLLFKLVDQEVLLGDALDVLAEIVVLHLKDTIMCFVQNWLMNVILFHHQRRLRVLLLNSLLSLWFIPLLFAIILSNKFIFLILNRSLLLLIACTANVH